MFDEEFCVHLEYAISGATSKSADIDWRRCWCDGVLLPEDEYSYSAEQLLKNKELVTQAWIDEGKEGKKARGQFLYEMHILFGDKSLEKIRRGKRMEDCLPTEGADHWIYIDRAKRFIQVRIL